MKINKCIEIVASSKKRLNSMSQQTRQQVLMALKKRYASVTITIVDTIEDLESLVARNPDVVISGVKLILLKPEMGYDDSPKLWLSEYFMNNDINFTGSGASSMQLQLDKSAAKQNVLEAGLQSSAYFVSTMKEPTFEHNLAFPLFVKPTNRGHSKGIDEESVVNTHSELKTKILAIHDDCVSDALIEEYLSGNEYSVAVIEDTMGGHLAMPIEILTPADVNGNSFLSAAVKTADTEEVVAVTDGALKDKINDLAIGVFKSLGARDYGRIDIRLNASDVPYFIEANLTPGLSNHGYLSRCFSVNGLMNYDDMICHIVELGMERNVHISTMATFETTPTGLQEFTSIAA